MEYAKQEAATAYAQVGQLAGREFAPPPPTDTATVRDQTAAEAILHQLLQTNDYLNNTLNRLIALRGRFYGEGEAVEGNSNKQPIPAGAAGAIAEQLARLQTIAGALDRVTDRLQTIA